MNNKYSFKISPVCSKNNQISTKTSKSPQKRVSTLESNRPNMIYNEGLCRSLFQLRPDQRHN